MKEYPSQLATCLEVLDAIVRTPHGLRRFISGSAGKGKSFVTKALAKVLRMVGLHVKMLAVAAIGSQDDEAGVGSTIASAFNVFAVNQRAFDEKAYALSKVDVFIIDEVSMVSVRQARIMTNYFARGVYLRAGGADLDTELRQSRHVTKELQQSQRGLTLQDAWFGVNIIGVGDQMQLGTADADPLFTSDRLWGRVFRRNTLVLEEDVRCIDDTLTKFAQ